MTNYDLVMQETREKNRGKRLLLHSCCAPCSTYCLSELAPYFHVTVFYYNPNMDSREEYEKRKAEEIRYLEETGLAGFLDCDYCPEEFYSAVKGLEQEKEGGKRCEVCFRLRLSRTAQTAKLHGYDFFATTLTISPMKNAALLNEIGIKIEEELGVNYLPSDFKKRGGYLKSTLLSREHGLYRQNYCGCVFSKAERARSTYE